MSSLIVGVQFAKGFRPLTLWSLQMPWINRGYLHTTLALRSGVIIHRCGFEYASRHGALKKKHIPSYNHVSILIRSVNFTEQTLSEWWYSRAFEPLEDQIGRFLLPLLSVYKRPFFIHYWDYKSLIIYNFFFYVVMVWNLTIFLSFIFINYSHVKIHVFVINFNIWDWIEELKILRLITILILIMTTKYDQIWQLSLKFLFFEITTTDKIQKYHFSNCLTNFSNLLLQIKFTK